MWTRRGLWVCYCYRIPPQLWSRSGQRRSPSRPGGLVRVPAISFASQRSPALQRSPSGPSGLLRVPAVSFGSQRSPARPSGLLRVPAVSFGSQRSPFARPWSSAGVPAVPFASALSSRLSVQMTFLSPMQSRCSTMEVSGLEFHFDTYGCPMFVMNSFHGRNFLKLFSQLQSAADEMNWGAVKVSMYLLWC